MTDPDDSMDFLPPDPADTEAEALDQPLPLEADPADVAEQKQSVDGFDEDYPGG